MGFADEAKTLEELATEVHTSVPSNSLQNHLALRPLSPASELHVFIQMSAHSLTPKRVTHSLINVHQAILLTRCNN